MYHFFAQFTNHLRVIFETSFAAPAHPARSQKIETSIVAISHCFQEVIIFARFLIISTHCSQRSSTSQSAGFSLTSSSICMSAARASFLSSENLSILKYVYLGIKAAEEKIEADNFNTSTNQVHISFQINIHNSLIDSKDVILKSFSLIFVYSSSEISSQDFTKLFTKFSSIF